VLSRAADTYVAQSAALAAESRQAAVVHLALRRTPPSDGEVVRVVMATIDPAHGGFGTAPKFPLVGPIRLMLQRVQDEQDEEARHAAMAALDAIGWSPLYDDAAGGFYRCAADAAWQEPEREKLLDVNAGLIDLYVEAAHVLGVQRYADRARDALAYVQNWLADPVDGGWGGFERAAADPGSGDVPPRVDRTLFAGWNGSMVSTALHLAHAFEDDALGRFALTSLERVLALCYRPGQGMAHYAEGAVRAGHLLEDQFAVAGACLDAHDATGNIVYEMMAQELALHAMRTLWDARRAAFLDRPPVAGPEAIGRLADPLVPFAANCDAAAVLHRLALATSKPEFARTADLVLGSMAADSIHHGPAAAHYLLARRAARAR